jgi:hypothetical protein
MGQISNDRISGFLHMAEKLKGPNAQMTEIGAKKCKIFVIFQKNHEFYMIFFITIFRNIGQIWGFRTFGRSVSSTSVLRVFIIFNIAKVMKIEIFYGFR